MRDARRGCRRRERRVFASDDYEQADTDGPAIKVEIPLKDISRGKKIGTGSFGDVFGAVAAPGMDAKSKYEDAAKEDGSGTDSDEYAAARKGRKVGGFAKSKPKAKKPKVVRAPLRSESAGARAVTVGFAYHRIRICGC